MEEEGCFAIVAFLVVAAIVVGYWYVVVGVAGVPAVEIGATLLSLVFLWNYVRALAIAMLPERVGADDRRLAVPVGTGPDPAYKQYFFDQALRDYRHVVTTAFRLDHRVAAGPWCADLVRWLLTGRAARAPRPAISGMALVFTVPLGLVYGAALCASLAVAAVLAAALGLLHLAVVAGAVVASGLAAGALRAVEGAGQLVRRILISCPHPGCYRPIGLPVYECPGPGCGRRHHHLRPGAYGVLVRTCVCSQRLPTLLRRGRHGLAAYCPHCAGPLPDRAGTARAAHIPVLGGASAGKTMLLMSAMVALTEQADRAGFELAFASAADRVEFERARAELRGDRFLSKTIVRPPRAFLVYVGVGRHRRLLYFYDAAGETMQSVQGAQRLGYLQTAEGALFVIDPFSVPGLVGALDPAGRQAAADALPSPEDPDTTLTRIGNVIRAMSARRSSLPVAVVVTKCDALQALAGVPELRPGTSGPAVAAWLEGVGLGALNRSLGMAFGDVEYWAVSAKLALRGDAGGRAVAAPVRWLLACRGLPLPELPEGA